MMLQMDFTLSRGLVPSEWCSDWLVLLSWAGSGTRSRRGGRGSERQPAVDPKPWEQAGSEPFVLRGQSLQARRAGRRS